MEMVRKNQRYTVQDYMTWDDEKRWEIIDGIAYDMSPAPGIAHQEIVGNFYRKIGNWLEGKQCRVFIAPTDVVFADDAVVQPDVFVVCDPKKITERNVQGAPDLVIEVLSLSTSKKDNREKMLLYERHGVKEYILVEPEGQFIRHYFLTSTGVYNRGDVLDNQEILRLNTLSGIEIPLWEVFGVEKKMEEA